jgi:hypothetical protein
MAAPALIEQHDAILDAAVALYRAERAHLCAARLCLPVEECWCKRPDPDGQQRLVCPPLPAVRGQTADPWAQTREEIKRRFGAPIWKESR